MTSTVVRLIREAAFATGRQVARCLGFEWGSRVVLDLGCGAGGVAVGYARAGWVPVGVDIVPQPSYPFDFILADMLEIPLEGYQLHHVSAPCQRWSKMLRCRPELRLTYPDLITPMRPRLQSSPVPWVMENVEGAPLISPVTFCSWAFGYEHYRHRLIESPMPIAAPRHREHVTRASRAGHWEPGTFISVAGHCAPIELAREVMDIHWTPREELGEAVPPYFTQLVGLQAHMNLLVHG